MEEKHRSAIQKNFVSLVERTDLDKMVAALYEKGVFSHEMISPYNETSKDARTRKRLLYVDITRRGPRAFGHLLDALSEAGYWDIVRDLDPNSSLHFRPQSTISSKSDESNFVSIRNEKKKTKNGVGPNKNHVEDLPNPAPHEDSDESDPLEIPKFNVVKSTKFMEVSDDDGSKIKLYPTRGWNRGYLVVFSYIKFKENTDKHRAGADVDCKNLKYLFAELGMKVVSYQNLTREETLDALDSLQRVSDGECVFIVVSSHGYARAGTDVDVRCSDGSIISIFEFIDHFSDLKFPALRGIPKVFIFQICRGPNGQSESKFFTDGQGIPHASPQAQRDPPSAHQLPPPAKQLPPPNTENNRIYSDILIAQSTLPGFVSYRDRKKGSWYIQVLCDVFAARAHDTHVEELFGLVDTELHKNYRVQTSERSNWGFNRRLYLHPGLYEGPPPMNQPTSHPAS